MFTPQMPLLCQPSNNSKSLCEWGQRKFIHHTSRVINETQAVANELNPLLICSRLGDTKEMSSNLKYPSMVCIVTLPFPLHSVVLLVSPPVVYLDRHTDVIQKLMWGSYNRFSCKMVNHCITKIGIEKTLWTRDMNECVFVSTRQSESREIANRWNIYIRCPVF